MKIKIRKIPKILILMLIVLGTLAGCSAGSTIETTIAINENLSGVRTMNVVIDDSVFEEYFTGTIEELNSVIANNCPSDLTWKYDASTGAKIYTFELSFSSVEDYQTKVKRILGNENQEDVLALTAPDTIWANGFYLKEEFTSENLLEWLRTAIIDAGMVDSSNSGNILSNGNTNVTFAGETYSASSYACVDEISYVEIDGFDIYTTFKGTNEFDRTIVLTLPAKTMAEKGKEIEAYVAKMVPEGATATWKKEDNGTQSYSVTKNNMNAKDMATFMKSYYGTESTEFSTSENESQTSPFYLGKCVSETIDYSNFVLGDAEYSPKLQYFVKSENGYSVPNTSTEEGAEYTLYVKRNLYGGYTADFNLNFEKIFSVTKLDIHSKVTLFSGYERTFDFEFNQVPSENELEQIESNFNKLFAANQEASTDETTETTVSAPADGESKESTDYEKEFNIKRKSDTTDGLFTYTLIQSGNETELHRSSNALFDNEGEISFTSNFNLLKLKYDVGYKENLYIDNLIAGKAENCVINHTITLPLGTKISYPTEEGILLDGNTITIEDSGTSISIVAVGERTNFWAIAFYLLIATAILLAILTANSAGVFDILKTKMTTKTQHATSQTQEKAFQQPSAPENSTEEFQATFCTQCGSKADSDAIVCTKCGAKLEK